MQVDGESDSRVMEDGLQLNSDSLMLELTGTEVLGIGSELALVLSSKLISCSRKIIFSAELTLF